MKIGIITDIHENARLLSEALRTAAAFRCDEIACLGDIVGFDSRFYDYHSHRDAGECLRLVRTNCRWITKGNHDLHAAGIFPSYLNGFIYPVDWFSMEPGQRTKISQGKVWSYEGDSPNNLTENDFRFLRDTPEYIITQEPGIPCLFSHYFAPDFTGSTTTYVERKSQLCHHWDILTKNNVIYSFAGHSHNHLTGFAFKSAGVFSKAVHLFPGESFYLGLDLTAVILPPLSGDKGRRGFTILDTENRQIKFINLV